MLQRLGVQRFMLQRLLLQRLMIQMLRLQRLMLQRLMLQRFMLHVYTFINISNEILMGSCKTHWRHRREHLFGGTNVFRLRCRKCKFSKESRIKFRNATPVDVLTAVPLYGNGQRDVANGQRTVNARSTQRSTHGQRNGSI